jgi:hypothetical protein
VNSTAPVVCDDATAAAAGVIVAEIPVPAATDAPGRNEFELAPGANGFMAIPAVGMLAGAENRADAADGGARGCGGAKLAQAMRVRLASWMTKERLPMYAGSLGVRETYWLM